MADSKRTDNANHNATEPESTVKDSKTETVKLVDFGPSDPREFAVGQELIIEIGGRCPDEFLGEGRLGDLLKTCLIAVRLQSLMRLRSYSEDSIETVTLTGSVLHPALLRVELVAL